MKAMSRFSTEVVTGIAAGSQTVMLSRRPTV
jgi:hypothetical protein